MHIVVSIIATRNKKGDHMDDKTFALTEARNQIVFLEKELSKALGFEVNNCSTKSVLDIIDAVLGEDDHIGEHATDDWMTKKEDH